MKFQIHFTKKDGFGDDIEDSYVLEGESLGEIRMKNNAELVKRNLDYRANKCWSQEIF